MKCCSASSTPLWEIRLEMFVLTASVLYIDLHEKVDCSDMKSFASRVISCVEQLTKC